MARDGIFICYRRGEGYAGRLAADLRRTFDPAKVFHDVRSIRAGTPFAAKIREAIRKSGVLLVVIGPGWLDARDANGNRRLELPDDFVATEIREGLANGLTIIPVLVGGAMPVQREQLPESLRPVAELEAHELSDRYWDAGLDALASTIKHATTEVLPEAQAAAGTPPPVKEERPSPGSMQTYVAAGAAAILLPIFIASMYNVIRSGASEAPPAADPPSTQSTAAAIEPSQDWPLVAEESFSGAAAQWSVGDYLANQPEDRFVSKAKTSIVDGRYRMEVDFKEVSARYQGVRYGPQTNFYAAIDVTWVSYSAEEHVSAGLLFGRVGGADYAFSIGTNGNFALTRYDGKAATLLIPWTPSMAARKSSYRLSLLVENNEIRMFVDDKPVGSLRDPAFTGGTLGVIAEGLRPGVSLVVDFDNFVLRRKP